MKPEKNGTVEMALNMVPIENHIRNAFNSSHENTPEKYHMGNLKKWYKTKRNLHSERLLTVRQT